MVVLIVEEVFDVPKFFLGLHAKINFSRVDLCQGEAGVERSKEKNELIRKRVVSV